MTSLAAAALLAALWATPAHGASAKECKQAEPSFGICSFDAVFEPQAGDFPMQAGSHPEAFSVELAVNTEEIPVGIEGPETIATEELKDLRIFSPPGLVGSPTAVPRCSSADFISAGSVTNCSAASALGTARIEFQAVDYVQTVPVYNLVPAPGVAAKIGFVVENVAPVTVDLRLNPEPPHNVIAEVTNVTQVRYFFASLTTLWGVPADPSHDEERGKCAFTPAADSCKVDAAEVPFLTLPTRCDGPLLTEAEADSWQHPNEWVVASTESHDELVPPNPLGPTACSKLPFNPEASAKPTTDQAESPSGLEFGIDVKDENLLAPDGYAASQIRKTVVTLPAGMTLNPSVAEGLLVCTPEQYDAEELHTEPGQGCPQAAKVGSVEVETPLLEGAISKGSVFVAQQDDPATSKPGAENPFDSLLAIYITVAEPQRGVFVKLAGEVEPDPQTGQILTTVEDIPQLPFSHFRFRFREGARSPLITPPVCGTYTTQVQFTPWSDPGKVHPESASFEITKGVGGGPCPPGGAQPFAPGFLAGTLSAEAKAYSPFYARLTRRDGDQDMTRFSFTLPPGLVGKIAGVSRCSEAEIAVARAKSGRAELAAPSCPPGSEIGSVAGGAGVGSQLTYVEGKLYLAGPVGGSPLSIVAIVPAVAGPFDVGNVVTRVALTLNPITAQVEVDGANSEPIPHILAGIPLRVRDVRVLTDRPQFTLNPSDCSPQEILGQLWGGGANPFSALDDAPVSLAQRFGAVNCARLGFKPRLKIMLKGGTRRGAHPALKAVVTPRPNDANFARALVTLPRSAFLDQGHIRTICTRVQFAAGEGHGAECPPGARYGYARAWSPLLEEPLEGPVFLRSSNNNLPDLVVALHGLVDIELSSRIDSVRGGIRSTFAAIPDAPVSRFVLEMQGGRKGLIVNSTDLCRAANRAKANLKGQNNRRRLFGPRVVPLGCKTRRNP